MIRWFMFSICVVVGGATAAPPKPPPPALKTASGELRWVVAGNPRDWRPELVLGGKVVADLRGEGFLDIVHREGDAPVRMRFSYLDWEGRDNAVIATTSLTTLNKTRFDITDFWWGDAETPLQLKREIRVAVVGRDFAFASGVEMYPRVSPMLLNDVDVFVPGIWYATSAHTPKSGLITDVGQQLFILREDRMSLPLVSARERSSGQVFTLAHVRPSGATIRADDRLERLVDERLRFGSLGVQRLSDTLVLTFLYPGTEGKQTSIFGYKPELRTVERFHPIKVDATQHYELMLGVSRSTSFIEQLRGAWRSSLEIAKPQIVEFDARGIYQASINVLDHYWTAKADVAGFPFSVSLPDGVVKDSSLQMGFVGQQLPCASYLIDEGLRTNRPEILEKGEKIVEFWAKNSFNEHGVPRTWYDLEPQPHWRNYNTFLRVVTDGTSGMLRAWQIEQAASRDKPEWIAFARRVGDWLLKVQNEDGSFFREWKFDGSAASKSKTSTLHPVRLLIDLSCATGEMKYRDAALRAGEFAIQANANGATYVGGTPDNPDVVDKEAGWIAMDSYLALYDVTQKKKWLDAAVDAASFTETWIYGWNLPLPIDQTDIGVPLVETFAGSNLIATGHSGVDNFLSFASLSYARLWIYTGDEHWFDVANLLQHNSAQFIEPTEKRAGSLGYAVPGLQVEAFSLAVNRGHAVKVWLPWLTSATLEPMVRMREVFGVMDVKAIGQLDIGELKRRNSLYARDRGYGSIPAK